jgi:hypothetical protein
MNESLEKKSMGTQRLLFDIPVLSKTSSSLSVSLNDSENKFEANSFKSD